MIKNIFVAGLLLFTTSLCMAEEKIELYVGEIKILELGDIERIAMGNPEVASNSLINNGQLLLIAEVAGISNLHIWFNNDTEKDYTIQVIEKPGNLVKRKMEVEDALSAIDGLEISIVGDRIVLSGLVAFGHEDTINKVVETYEEVVININFAINKLVRKKLEIEEMLAYVDGLAVRIVGEHIVLTGDIDEGYKEAIDTVKGVYTEAMDLTKSGDLLNMESPDNKMVIVKTKITDFNKNYLETLGVDWDTQIQGPSAGGTTAFERGNALGAAITTPLNFENSLAGIDSSLGFFGIATEITSRINFAVDSGNAVILAEPRLSARSGGEASFHSGGEFPIETSNTNGTTVTFKEFGIKLSVSPVVDVNNNVRAKVSTELSSIDQSVAINGIPGLLTRTSEADVILRSGETLVMSGLLNQEISKNSSGIKLLKDIPILGALFRSDTFQDKKSELVIFVTPTVFDAQSESNKKTMEYVKESIGKLLDAMDEESIDIIY